MPLEGFFFYSAERLKVCPEISAGGVQCTSFVTLQVVAASHGPEADFSEKLGDSSCRVVNLLK